MKTIIKQMVVVAFLMTAMPALAAENDNSKFAPTKGSKSYQSARSLADDVQQQLQTRAENTKNVKPEDVETAAGAMEPAQNDDKSLADDLRLPRKN